MMPVFSKASTTRKEQTSAYCLLCNQRESWVAYRDAFSGYDRVSKYPIGSIGNRL